VTVYTQAVVSSDLRPSGVAGLATGVVEADLLLAWALSEAQDESWRLAGDCEGFGGVIRAAGVADVCDRERQWRARRLAYNSNTAAGFPYLEPPCLYPGAMLSSLVVTFPRCSRRLAAHPSSPLPPAAPDPAHPPAPTSRFPGQQQLNERLSSALATGAKLPAELLQLLLAPARQAACVVSPQQNAAAAAQLLPEDCSSGGGSAGGDRQQQERRLRALLSHNLAGAVDALPPGGGARAAATMAADPGGGSVAWLARAMRELGYPATASEAAFKALLKQFPGRLDEASVAEALGLMARTVRGLEPDGLGLSATLAAVLAEGGTPSAPLGEAGSATWNVSVVVDVIKGRAPGLSWRGVAEALDHEGFLVPEPAGLGILTTAFRRATGESLPISALVGRRWANTAGQLSLLAAATVAPPDAVPWDASPRRVAPLEGLAGGASPIGTANGCWLSVDLLSVLCQLADAGQAAAVRSLLEAGPGKACREVLLVSLGALRPTGDADWGTLERALWGSLLPPVFAGHANSGLVLRRLWDSNPTALLKAAGLWAGSDAARVGRVLDITQQLGVLPGALDAAPPELSLAMAEAAARRDALGATLDHWLAERLARYGSGLGRAVVAYLEARMGPQLARETAACFLRALHTYVACGGGGDVRGEVARAQAAALAAYPGSEALLASAAAVPAAGSSSGPFPHDVEDEANKHFHAVRGVRAPVGGLEGRQAGGAALVDSPCLLACSLACLLACSLACLLAVTHLVPAFVAPPAAICAQRCLHWPSLPCAQRAIALVGPNRAPPAPFSSLNFPDLQREPPRRGGGGGDAAVQEQHGAPPGAGLRLHGAQPAGRVPFLPQLPRQGAERHRHAFWTPARRRPVRRRRPGRGTAVCRDCARRGARLQALPLLRAGRSLMRPRRHSALARVCRRGCGCSAAPPHCRPRPGRRRGARRRSSRGGTACRRRRRHQGQRRRRPD
jgi:hypothetical protein